MREQSTFTYEIVKHVGVITEHESGWKQELNIISWNGNSPRYDIRSWNPDHTRMSKGITLTMAEGALLGRLLVKSSNRREIMTMKVGDKIRIIDMEGEPQYTGKEGTIEFIDDAGQLHGTWGGCAVIAGVDKIEKVEE